MKGFADCIFFFAAHRGGAVRLARWLQFVARDACVSTESWDHWSGSPILADCIRVLEILEHVGSSASEMQKTRTEVLRRAVENIRW
jgi:hypothetical protein